MPRPVRVRDLFSMALLGLVLSLVVVTLVSFLLLWLGIPWEEDPNQQAVWACANFSSKLGSLLVIVVMAPI